MNTTDYFTNINAMFLFCIFICLLLLAVGWQLVRKADKLKKEQDSHLKATNTNALLNKALSAKNAALQRVYINRLKTDATYERYKAQKKAEHLEELLTEAKAEADNEYQLRRQAEKNLAEANDEVDTWRARAMRAENALGSVKVTRDPKTGRMVSTKPRPTAKQMEKGLAAFDAMMGNIEQLQGLTVRKLCDEVKQNAGSGI